MNDLGGVHKAFGHVPHDGFYAALLHADDSIVPHDLWNRAIHWLDPLRLPGLTWVAGRGAVPTNSRNGPARRRLQRPICSS